MFRIKVWKFIWMATSSHQTIASRWLQLIKQIKEQSKVNLVISKELSRSGLGLITEIMASQITVADPNR